MTAALPRLPELAALPPLVVPLTIDGEGITSAQRDAEPTPEWDAAVAEHGHPTPARLLPVAG